MHNHKNIKAMAAQGNIPLGMYIGIPSPHIVEFAALAGLDYVMLDLEHNVYSPDTIAQMIRAADACGLAVAARIAETSLMLPLLDFGLIGMKVPHVHSREQVEELVRITKFAPVGARGFSGHGRAQRYGRMPFADYKHEADDEIFLMVMIEDAQGIANMEEIISTPGLDYVAVGPGDLSQALGCVGDTKNPKVIETTQKILQLADKYGVKYPGGGAPLIIGDDRALMVDAMTELVRKHRS